MRQEAARVIFSCLVQEPPPPPEAEDEAAEGEEEEQVEARRHECPEVHPLPRALKSVPNCQRSCKSSARTCSTFAVLLRQAA